VTAKNDESSRFFRLLLEKKLIDAEKNLEQMKEHLDKSQSNVGYLKALEGLLLTYRSSDDEYLYFNRTDLTVKLVGELRRDFKMQSTSELHDEYDKGYFKAMVEFTRVLEKVRPWSTKLAKSGNAKPAPD